jgi:outer membrane protein insertion porin family
MGIQRLRLRAGSICLLMLAVLVGVPEFAVADDELDFGLERRQIARIDFEGNVAWTDEELRALLTLEGSPWYAPWRADRYRLDELEQGIQSIRRRYRNDGYREVAVRLLDPVEVGESRDEIRIVIDEGPRTLVNRVTFTGVEPLTADELRPLLRYHEGGAAPYRESALGGDLFRVTEAYLSRGHLTAIVRNRVVESDSTVSISYEIEAGPVFTIRDVAVIGAERVKMKFIERELVVEPGQPFTAQAQNKSEAQLLQTGWFRDVTFEATNLDLETGQASMVVYVLERPTGFWELGLGTGSRDRVRVVGAWGDTNFLGTGKGLTLRGRIFGIYDVDVDNPDRNQLYWDHEEQLIYRHPHFMGTRRTIVSRLFSQFESRPSSGVQLRQLGLSFRTALLSRGANFLDSEFSVTRTRKQSLSDQLQFDNSRAITSAISLVYRIDHRDDLFNPTRGRLLEIFGQTAGGPLLLGDNSFNKLLARYVRVYPVAGAILAMRLEAGWGRAYSTSADIAGPDAGVPIEERYFAGGSNTVRGYREASLGPRLSEDDATLVQDPQFLTDRLSGGGNALMVANVELRFPIIPEWNIGGEFFFDTGNVWANWDRVTADSFRLTGSVVDEEATNAYRTSFGMGLTYRTVVGPLRLDYGIPLRRATFNSRDEMGNITGSESDPPNVWHFSLGHAF